MTLGASLNVTRTLVLVIALFCTACGILSNRVTRPEQLARVQVTVVSPASGIVRNDEFELDNCSGGSEVRQPLASIAQVEKSVTVASEAYVVQSEASLLIPEELQAELTSQVDEAYKEVLEAARSEVDETEMGAGAHTRYTFTIIWEQQAFASTVSLATNGTTFGVPYTYTLDIPRLGSAKPGFCTG